MYTQAYLALLSATKEKSFITLAPGGKQWDALHVQA
jgi:hypothetical protein